MDRVLNELPISKNNLQLLAATCIFLSSKLREPSARALPPHILIYYTDHSINKRDLMVSFSKTINFFCIIFLFKNYCIIKRCPKFINCIKGWGDRRALGSLVPKMRRKYPAKYPILSAPR